MVQVSYCLAVHRLQEASFRARREMPRLGHVPLVEFRERVGAPSLLCYCLECGIGTLMVYRRKADGWYELEISGIASSKTTWEEEEDVLRELMKGGE